MPLSDEARLRFATYAAGTDPADVEAQHAETTLFAFVAWALVHEPDALADHFAYENAMTERRFTEFKRSFVHTVIITAQGIVTAYERERANV